MFSSLSARPPYVLFIVGLVAIIVVTLLLALIVTPSPSASTLNIKEAHEQAQNWIFANFTPQTGLFTYLLNPTTGEFSLENNAIRQLMASRILAAESSTRADLLESHTQNLEFLMENWYREDENGGYVYFKDKSKLGANAMLLRTLVASPLFAQYENEAELLARGILSLQQDDGAFKPWYVAPPYETDEAYLLTFYSGEALVALVEYYEKTLDEKYLQAAEKSADFYINLYAVNLEENYFPAYVPWHTIALNKLYKIDPQQKYVDAIFIMNDKLLEIQDTTNVVGRFYNPDTPQYGTPHSSSDAIYTEGLAYAYEIANLFGDIEHAASYRNAVLLGAQHIMSLQYKTEDGSLPLPAYTYVGGVAVSETAPFIRVDTTQHSVDAFEKIIEVGIGN